MFTVIMPAYNAEKYLREAIESILNQTFRDFELLIINGASVDKTGAIAEEYAAKDPRVRVIFKPVNTGVADSMNLGIEQAKYDWIAILDSDDIATPDRLEKQAKAIREQPDVIAWAGYCHYVNESMRLLYISKLGRATEAEFKAMKGKGEPIMFGHTTFTYRRDIFNQIGGYASHIVPCDLDLMDRLSDRGVMLTLPDVLAYYRVHTNSMSFTKFFRVEHDIRYIFARRKAQMEGRTLTWEAYEARETEKSSFTQFRDKVQGYGRLYWYYAGLAMGERKPFRFARYLSASLVCTPLWTSKRIVNQLQERFA